MQDNAAATWRPKCGADSSRSSSPWDCSNPLRTGCWEPRLSENRSTLVPKTWKTSGTTKYKTPFTVRSLGSRANGVSNCRCFRKDSSSCSHLAWRHPGTAWLHAKVHPCMTSKKHRPVLWISSMRKKASPCHFQCHRAPFQDLAQAQSLASSISS